MAAADVVCRREPASNIYTRARGTAKVRGSASFSSAGCSLFFFVPSSSYSALLGHETSRAFGRCRLNVHTEGRAFSRRLSPSWMFPRVYVRGSLMQIWRRCRGLGKLFSREWMKHFHVDAAELLTLMRTRGRLCLLHEVCALRKLRWGFFFPLRIMKWGGYCGWNYFQETYVYDNLQVCPDFSFRIFNDNHTYSVLLIQLHLQVSRT